MTDLPDPLVSSIKVRRIDFYPDEWLAGTATLDAVEMGVYISICSLIYSHGGPVEKAEVRRFVKLHGNAFNRAFRRLEELGKIDVNGSEIDQKRCGNELKHARKRKRNWMENIGHSNETNGVADPSAGTSTRARTSQPSTSNLHLDTPQTPQRGAFRKKRNGKGQPDPAAVPAPPWAARCAAWAKSGFWQPLWGPTPAEPNCHAPPELIAQVRHTNGRT